ncbi:hypothetical protein KAFR_0L01880 [Kazachstania africana CBS 2517]|uniref:Uncharacterized protein n=1 Tax=Kazachstania africana (strain ATCC 22294 / BCRC 22015 / CBS 2517 / CECT 1963 / NBRC 1671 / NRRL Y-8276) TaxID=1071382 RepID=H2B2E8_KAZAF|nr:hypothetical protein KAFR_0L01880 [Kazachstania africana CBS 2517]CCF60798.1 hypothetical protein KAFR_0L01880 [Kazachstania africana CBS 2517]
MPRIKGQLKPNVNVGNALGQVQEVKNSNTMLIAVSAYTKRMEDEISIKPGDKIQVITDDEDYNDGWYVGRNLRTGKEGLFPKIFTQKLDIDAQDSPSLKEKSQRRGDGVYGNEKLQFDVNCREYSQSGSNSNSSYSFLKTSTENKSNHADKSSSVNTTMNDIDKALAELRSDSLELLLNKEAISTPLTKHLNVTASTPELDITPSITSQSIDTEKSSRSIIDELDPSLVAKWTPEQVSNYFLKKGFNVEAAGKFEKHQITGKILLELELGHLKELEINSFGLRFEIFKEISTLKGTAESATPITADKRKTQLLAATSLTSLRRSSHNYHSRKLSQSLDALPSDKTPETGMRDIVNNSRPSSVLFDSEQLRITSDKLAGLAISSDEKVFESPGKAPKPPSYPSPVQPHLSPSVNQQLTTSPHTSSDYKFFSNINNTGNPYTFPNSTTSSNDSGKFRFPSSATSGNDSIASYDFKLKNSSIGLKFPSSASRASSGVSPIPTPRSEYFANTASPVMDGSKSNRNSVIYTGHKKTVSGGSFVDLFNRISTLSPVKSVNESNERLERPVSAYYGSHSRTPSSVYDHSRRASNSDIKKHRRNSSLLSFLSPSKNEDRVALSPSNNTRRNTTASANNKIVSHSRKSSLITSPLRENQNDYSTTVVAKDKKRDNINHKPRHSHKQSSSSRSISTIDPKDVIEVKKLEEEKKRSASEAIKMKKKAVRPKAKKQQTTAFLEGIRNVTVKDALKTSDCYGWMNKKGNGTMGVWKTRFFVLHGTRLSYFASTEDTRERGLIDITSHKVVPARDDDKLVSIYAASTGRGKYCFKLIPPQPGSKKGLTFTQPRVHYFAVDSKEEMRNWLAAMIKATIDVDDTVPIVSSYAMPTVSLTRAQEMLDEAKEELKEREQQRFLNEEDEDQLLWEQQQRQNELMASGFL